MDLNDLLSNQDNCLQTISLLPIQVSSPIRIQKRLDINLTNLGLGTERLDKLE